MEFGPAAAFTLLSQYEVWTGPIPHLGGSISGPKPVLSALVALISVGLALRLRHPLLALVLAMGPFGVHGVLDHFVGRGGPNLFEVFLSQVFMVYSTAANTSGRRTYAGGAIVVVLQLLGYGSTLPGSFDQASGEWVFYAIGWAFGKTLRRRALRGDRLEARTAELEAKQQEEIQAAIADERARCRARARVAAAARAAVHRRLRPAAGRRRVRVARAGGRGRGGSRRGRARRRRRRGRCGGAAGGHRRGRFARGGREPGDEEQLAPQPSLRHLNMLVHQIRETGLVIDVDETCPQDGIPPGVDLSAYRIAQEALTNVLKHAGATRVGLKVRCDGAAVEVTVEDDGRGPSSNGSLVGGHGLIGMRERVSLFGGRFEAGARDGGGFRVFAHIPYEAT